MNELLDFYNDQFGDGAKAKAEAATEEPVQWVEDPNPGKTKYTATTDKGTAQIWMQYTTRGKEAGLTVEANGKTIKTRVKDLAKAKAIAEKALA